MARQGSDLRVVSCGRNPKDDVQLTVGIALDLLDDRPDEVSAFERLHHIPDRIKLCQRGRDVIECGLGHVVQFGIDLVSPTRQRGNLIPGLLQPLIDLACDGAIDLRPGACSPHRAG